MPDLSFLPSLRTVADSHGLRARRSLGQNFLFDENLLDRIAEQTGDLSQKTVIEIGPGPGGLTRAMLRAGANRIIALEKDTRCIAALASLVDAADGHLRVVEGDALDGGFRDLAGNAAVVVGNLPFNIATELLMHLLESDLEPVRMILMFQKEVANRIVAGPGSKAYGRLSVLVQWQCEVKTCFDVPASAFVPAPKVQATVLRITPRDTPAFPASRTSLQAVTSAAFGQRRKTLRNSLSSAFDDAKAAATKAGLDPNLRAEAVDLEGFCRLATVHEQLFSSAG